MISNLRNLLQEIKELGPRRAAYRILYESEKTLGMKSISLKNAASIKEACLLARNPIPDRWTRYLPYADSHVVADALRDRIDTNSLLLLKQTADDAVDGRIRCFSRWCADFGKPVDWQRDIFTGGTWNGFKQKHPQPHQQHLGDIKGVWELGRFPHAFFMARAAAFFPDERERWARALMSQMKWFTENNPPYTGVHWQSGQEIALRALSWLFALDTLILAAIRPAPELNWLAENLIAGAFCIRRRFRHTRMAVYNNHLISEAIGLYVIGSLFPETKMGQCWRALGRETLIEESDRQFYSDGGYIQQSHNYHRAVVTGLICACVFAAATGDGPPEAWRKALERSLNFLVAHQNPADGRLPNYGMNDGSMPAILSTCDFSDFRPVLQTASLLVNGRRLYDPGPWDEMPAWLLGPKILGAPKDPLCLRSVSFPVTGYHILRGNDPSSFCFMRCGNLLDRFSQIDMLHLDVWWHGENVLVDGGSYLYNGPVEWHDHFMRTESHNTIEIDGWDQMLHYRQFKLLYWTKAKLLAFEDHGRWAIFSGEHYGYRRHSRGIIHGRAVLYVKDDLWIVLDSVTGKGNHEIRLHWLGGNFPYSHDSASGRLTLNTRAGPFRVQVINPQGQPLPGDVVAGGTSPPRGWCARYYGEKAAVPSLAVMMRGDLPVTMVSLLHGCATDVSVSGSSWKVETPTTQCCFSLQDGGFANILITDREACT